MVADLEGTRVLIFQQRGWAATIGQFVAKQLQQKGCVLAAVTFKKSTDRFIRDQQEVRYELIRGHDSVMEFPERVPGVDGVSLGQVCEALGVDTVWPLVQSMRQHVRTYGEKYYYAFRQNVDDEGIVAYVKAVYLFLTRLLDEFRPDVIIAPNFVALPQIMMSLLARRRGLRMIGFVDTKVSGVYAFTYSYVADDGPFVDRVLALNGGAESANRHRARQYVAESRTELKKPGYMRVPERVPPLLRVKRELVPFILIGISWRDRGLGRANRLANLGVTPDYRSARVILRDHYAEKYYRYRASRWAYEPLPAAGSYAYFPLQVQPEETIDVIAPYFNNQIEVARLTAQSLPGDLTLVVKEHPAMVGKRGPSYYEKIARSPNVKLVDFRIPSEQVLRGAALVISPGGTTVSEAAFLRVPAIQLGNLGYTQLLPNVRRHTDMTTLARAIGEALALDVKSEDYDRRLEDYVAAAYDVGFELDYARLWERGGEEMETLWHYYEREVERAVNQRPQ